MAFKKIGILGGMGPGASASFYSKIVGYCQKKHCAVQDTDFPPMVMYSLPLAGFDESGIVDKKAVLKQLVHGASTLKNAGCDFIVMPCNTVHCFASELEKKAKIKVISIVEETVKKIKNDKIKKVGLVGSETTLKLKLYQEALNKSQILCVSPCKKDYPAITRLILEIMAGSAGKNAKEGVVSIMKTMENKSAEAIVLGCTEIPLAVSQKDSGIKVYDTLQILAEAAVDFAAGKCRSKNRLV